MAKLPAITGEEVIAAFAKIGFVLARINGSHHILKKPGHRFVLAVPVHGNDPVAKGTLRSLIRDSGVSVEEFTALL
jgi:predicted RNA binding protein YcfA (HicA-like mRNA interferase family)